MLSPIRRADVLSGGSKNFCTKQWCFRFSPLIFLGYLSCLTCLMDAEALQFNICQFLSLLFFTMLLETWKHVFHVDIALLQTCVVWASAHKRFIIFKFDKCKFTCQILLHLSGLKEDATLDGSLSDRITTLPYLFSVAGKWETF